MDRLRVSLRRPMKKNVSELEPMPRDPKKLRRTALILVTLMVVSGIGVLIAYNRLAARQAEVSTPAFVTRIDKNFKLWRQDESEAGLLDLRGDVVVISPVVFSDPESWKTTREILKELSDKYRDRDDFHIVMITVDPEQESPKELGAYAAQLDAELPQWWLAGAQQESVHKFLKNRLKAGFYPHRKNGKWIYDPSLVVIDRDRHVRQATVRATNTSGKQLNFRNRLPFDFEQAAKWDQEGRSKGLEQTNVETLRNLLFETVDSLLESPAQNSL